jgi:hypothetical protein
MTQNLRRYLADSLMRDWAQLSSGAVALSVAAAGWRDGSRLAQLVASAL